MRRAGLAAATAAVIAAVALPALAAAGPGERAPSFAELLRATVDARIGFARLPAGAAGQPARDSAVYLGVTSRAVYLYGTELLRLDRGYPAAGAVRPCNSGVPCLPAVRDAVRDARAELAGALRSAPDILIAAASDAPFATLLLVARSVAEAGAARSMHLVIRSDQQLRALPVWVAPGRRLAVGDAANPALIASEVKRDGSVVVSSTRYYSRGPRTLDSAAQAVGYLGRIQLQSGRTTHFVTGEAGATVGAVAALVIAAADMFEHVVLSAPGQRVFRVTRSR